MALLCSTLSVKRTQGEFKARRSASPSSISPACLSNIALALVASGESMKIGVFGISPRFHEPDEVDEKLLRALDGEGRDQQHAPALRRIP